ncbi:MAG: methyltransferase, partial [Acaryochloridaceae cyanobacterium RL_2_7]|nr:methyltransferase [Acaryochloridaceae cyanobacterium RL_2_7]
MTLVCSADAPSLVFDIAFLTLITTGEAELARDYLQQLYQRLRIGGVLIVAVDNPQDRWVLEQLRKFEKGVKIRNRPEATVYWIEKSAELKKKKTTLANWRTKDCDELVKMVTRPGVFSHRRLDNGARQLLDAVDVYPEAKMIDIGCGCGSVALGLAMRDKSAVVHAVDANARAIDC